MAFVQNIIMVLKKHWRELVVLAHSFEAPTQLGTRQDPTLSATPGAV